MNRRHLLAPALLCLAVTLAAAGTAAAQSQGRIRSFTVTGGGRLLDPPLRFSLVFTNETAEPQACSVQFRLVEWTGRTIVDRLHGPIILGPNETRTFQLTWPEREGIALVLGPATAKAVVRLGTGNTAPLVAEERCLVAPRRETGVLLAFLCLAWLAFGVGGSRRRRGKRRRRMLSSARGRRKLGVERVPGYLYPRRDM